MTAALRIGILGAARIAGDGIVEPARVLGHRLLAVAARAAALAGEQGFPLDVDDAVANAELI